MALLQLKYCLVIRSAPTQCFEYKAADYQAVPRLKKGHDDVTCTFLSSVLHIQGEMARQPYVECGNVLLWNGEVGCTAYHRIALH